MLTSRFTFRRGRQLFEVLVRPRWDAESLRKAAVISRKAVPLFLEDDDFAAGGDVFALDFLLMQQTAEILEGEDLLEDLDIDQNDLRNCLEAEIRRLAARTRVAYYSHRIIPAKAAMTTLEGIADGLEYLGYKDVFPQADRAIFSSFAGNFWPRRQSEAFLQLLQRWETYLEEK